MPRDDLKEIPGSYGLPLIGKILQSLAVLRDWRTFYTRRRARYGSDVFKAAAGIESITVVDQKGIEALFDTGKFLKLYGFGALKPPPARVGHIVPTVFTNDDEHGGQKQFLLDLQRRRAPTMFATFDDVAAPYFERWRAAGAFDWGVELNALMSDFLFEWFLGARPDPADVEGWGLQLLPRGVLRLPGQGDAPVVARLERLLQVISSAPKFEEVAAMAAETAGLDGEKTAKQLLFYLGFNAWTGLHSVVRSVIAELTLHPEWQRRTVDEIRGVLEGGPELTLARLSSMPLLDAVIKETLRLHQPAPFAFGRAREDLVLHAGSGSYRVKKGQVVQGVIGCAHRDPAVFENPDAFDPGRFAGGAADRYLIWANGRDVDAPGAGDHMCAGRDVVYLTFKLFFVRLLPAYRWTLTEPPRWGAKIQPANRPATPIVCETFEPRPS